MPIQDKEITEYHKKQIAAGKHLRELEFESHETADDIDHQFFDPHEYAIKAKAEKKQSSNKNSKNHKEVIYNMLSNNSFQQRMAEQARKQQDVALEK